MEIKEDKLLWLDTFSFDLLFKNKIIEYLYVFKIFVKLSRSLTMNQQWKMMINIGDYDWKHGLMITINDLKTKRAEARNEKHHYIVNENLKPECSFEEIKDELAENERWSNLPYEERKKKIMPWTGNGKFAPDNINWSQPILEQETNTFKVTYILFDKIYGYYNAVVYSPVGLRQDGKQEVKKMRGRTYEDIKWIIKDAIECENKLRMTLDSKKEKTKSDNHQVDISKVKKMMGMSDDNRFKDLNDDNIF